MRGPGIGDDLVLDAGLAQPCVEGGDVFRGDELVRAAKEPEDRDGASR